MMRWLWSWAWEGTRWSYGLREQPADRWLAEDKWAHYAFAGWYWEVLNGLPLSVEARLWAFTVGAVAVEGVELWRYLLWRRDSGTRPWPFFADKVSLKDLAWDYAGLVTAVLLGWLRAFIWLFGG